MSTKCPTKWPGKMNIIVFVHVSPCTGIEIGIDLHRNWSDWTEENWNNTRGRFTLFLSEWPFPIRAPHARSHVCVSVCVQCACGIPQENGKCR